MSYFPHFSFKFFLADDESDRRAMRTDESIPTRRIIIDGGAGGDFDDIRRRSRFVAQGSRQYSSKLTPIQFLRRPVSLLVLVEQFSKRIPRISSYWLFN